MSEPRTTKLRNLRRSALAPLHLHADATGDGTRTALMVQIREASTARDAAGCARVYAPYVTDSIVSFEEVAPTSADMADRIGAAHLWLVAEADGAIIGFAYAARHRDRAAYRFACDVSIYLASSAGGRGLGTRLYGALLPELATRGLRMACAGVALPNLASVALHRRMGFVDVGVYRRIGWKFDAWHDVLWLQRPLDDLAPTTP